MKLTALAIAFLALIVPFVGAEDLPPLVGSFTGGSTTLTNTGAPLKMEAVFLSGTSSNFSVKVVNVTGYTNTLASGLTNELAYTPTVPLWWWRGGSLVLTTTSTNAAKYTVYQSR